MPAAASCANCGSRLPKRSRFCPECGTRIGAGPSETAVQELPPQETGPVPVELSTSKPRFFGVTRGALDAVRAHAGFVLEALSAHSSARMELFRLRRELADLLAQRAESAHALGEAVYAGDEEGSESARSRMAELDGLVAAKEEEMTQTATGAMDRIQRAQLQVQPTQIEQPTPVPEPYPEPSPAPQPVPVPEPSPEPSEPPGPTVVPEPSPVPSPPPQGE
ncbi:MAG: zinc ribbon domain-containing protein [Actinomycetota bacterium]|nr:zinc ribbon domain-containing protein [Actinomycetota bacterium]